MSNEHEVRKEIRGILRLLETTARVIETSPIVDPEEHEERCAQQFNSAIDHLTEIGAAPPGLFQHLETGASFSEISIACHQVAAYLREGCVDDFDFENMKKTVGDELKDFGETVKQSMPDFFKDFWTERTQEKSGADTLETVEIVSDEDEDTESADTYRKADCQPGRADGNGCRNPPRDPRTTA